MGKDSLIKLWKIIPKYSGNDNEEQNNKFQSLQGRNSILVKLEQMIKESKENILVLGTEIWTLKDFILLNLRNY